MDKQEYFMANKEAKETNMMYDKKNMTIFINAKSTEFVPDYLRYLLEYFDIPLDNDIVFTDGVIWNLLPEEDNK